MGTQKVTPSLIFTITVATVGSFQFGYNTGMIIREFINTLKDKANTPPSEILCMSLWSLFFVNRFGTHNLMLITNLLVVTSGCLTGLCKVAESVEMLILGHLVIGLFCELCTGFVLICISPTVLRLGIVGILVAQIFGLEFILGSEELLGFTIFPTLLQSAALPFCPESPTFLLIQRKEEENDASHDIQEMKDESASTAQEKQVTMLELFRPIIISIVLQLSQQLSGINAVFCYSTGIFEGAGVQELIYANVGAGVVNTVFTVVSLFLVERAGRRTLDMTDFGGMTFCSVLTTVSLLLKDEYNGISFVCIGAILVFVAFFEIGQGPGPAVMAVPSAAYYLGVCVFIIFTNFLVTFLIFIVFKVSETCHRTFEDITQAFEGQAHDKDRIVETNSIQPAKETTTTNVCHASFHLSLSMGKPPLPE
uniref:Major facilitator superfamily (MFS) profile domain-containing protein n=1 Tax=Aotus nancymaae TaxID=37293 RepID=A0A2K5EUT2_AOTNA